MDGERVEITEVLDALIAFRISGAGEHTVELDYHPDIIYFGLTVSLLFLALFLLTLLALRLRPIRRLLRGQAETVYPSAWDFACEDGLYDQPILPEGSAPMTLRDCLTILRVWAASHTSKSAEPETSDPTEAPRNDEVDKVEEGSIGQDDDPPDDPDSHQN